MAILRRNGNPQCLCSWTAPSPYMIDMIVAEGMSYYQFLRTEVPKLFHRNHLQCKSIRARCLLHVRGPVHHRRKYTSSHLRASVQRVRKTQCLKGPPPHVVHYLRKHALPPFCMYYNPPPCHNQTHAQNKYEACRTPAHFKSKHKRQERTSPASP